MITEKTIISGTEEELLEFFKQKYNLIEKEVKEVAEILEHYENVNPETPKQNIPAPVGNKVTTGIGNIFGGTSWGR